MLTMAFSIIRSNLSAFLVFLVFDTLINVSSRLVTPHLGLLAFFSKALLAYYVHRAVLFEERFTFAGFSLRHFGTFLWRSICLSLLFALILMVVSLPTFIAYGGSHLWDNTAASVAEFLLMLLVIPILFAWLGTWLPATVAGRASTFAEARMRSKATFLPLFIDLIVPTAIAPVSSFLVGAGLFARYLPAPLQFQGITTAYLPLAAIVLSQALQLLVTALYAVALSRAYLEAEQRVPVTTTADTTSIIQ